MKNPKINFAIDKKKDTSFLGLLLRNKKQQKRELGWALSRHKALLKKLNELKENSPRSSRIIRVYLDDFYAKNKDLMNRRLVQVRSAWETKRQKKFYQLVKKLFKDSVFPKGKYTAYLTAWNLYPRFLEDKTFFIPWSRVDTDFIHVVIAHEMLHFKFFDFFKKRYSSFHDPEHSFFVWHVSEIFNGVVQNSKPWLKVFKKRVKLYPEHAAIVRSVSRWQAIQKSIDAESFTSKIITTVRRRKGFKLE
ncbi:MAG: hypothetical protein UX26_C0006G0004 [Parcubacteria group bacterium GW2011_GWC1_45_9]|uniref:Uncharacterized protein n=1 Tax=Candidatus Woesebacteria bacterium GW2011_GWB1_39_12 TaxID=1618574 RepID=A0A0G0M3X8_9BACT|nr:MAG: hypothetical protein UT24_C0032G0003 [Candidatus Woesebacteria bacterium GW2011_GWB1_39_12]KKU17155.1 MAG: hypothetical protein UX26_C0006G0004 [Parcubacteria group bacterium GW2011_GWC1_45_9]HCI05606.1 hypothetical protein [Patescibacteria group bacterium]